ncbi:MAG: VOC family protein [Cytophagales bacterium]|uniref:VOC family protein n=1 Tax=Cyclobacterium marinum TaxID=104 RepID=UPI0030DA817C|nr:VOC family protein [Cytophagales bacterium]|tara:strand:- start:95687 stop:96181 length:495 start_codon:yes stop_codon:yes gene_type:complete
MKYLIRNGVVLLGFWLAAFEGQNQSNTVNRPIDLNGTQKNIPMNSFISIFEIPATEISRAVNFYQAILDIHIEKMEFPEMQMGIFPYEEQMVTGVIMKAEGYTPSASGVTIYLNGGDDLQVILDKVEKNGGEIIVPKSLHADESGFFAIFLDSEGNKMGLHSPN